MLLLFYVFLVISIFFLLDKQLDNRERERERERERAIEDGEVKKNKKKNQIKVSNETRHRNVAKETYGISQL